MQKSILSAVKIVAAILAAALAPAAFGVANYVYHERTANDASGGNPSACGGPQAYVPVLNPSASESNLLRFKVEYQFFTDTTKIYYTTDGSAPSGSKGVPSGTTLVADGVFQCTFTQGADTVDIWNATIPAQPAGTVVKYIVGAWHSGGGDEIFANSGTCVGCGNFNNSSLATVFQYTVGSATELYWDSNGNIAGAGAIPTGTWGTDNFWSSVFDGTGETAGWTAGQTAVFSAGTDANDVFTVTVSGTQTAGALRIEEGTVTLATGTAALGAGNLTVANGATLSTDSSLRISATAGATLNIDGGKLRTTNPGAAGTFYDADFAVTIGPAGATFEHVTANILNIVQTAMTITGPGGLTKTGAGVLAIAGTATYAGPTIINEGELRIRTSANRLPVTTAVTVNSPGILNLNGVAQQIGSLSGNGDVGLGATTLIVGDSTSTVFSGGIKNVANAGAGGVASGNGRVAKVGSGTLTLMGTNTFTGSIGVTNGAVTAAPGSVLCDPLADVFIQGGTLNLENASQTVLSISGNSGTLNLAEGHALTINPSSTRTFAGTVIGTGSLTKTGTGTTVLAGDNTYSGGTTVSGGTLRVSNSSGSGTGSGNVAVLAGGTLSGSGTVAGAVSLEGRIAPGTSPGTLNTGAETWNGGGSYVWEINDVDAGAGTNPGWDLINITGGLTINATPANKFVINITSLTETNTAGAVADFTDTTDYAWTILTTTAGISGFDPAAFTLDASGFSNSMGTGSFLVQTANGGNDLVLRFVHLPVIAAGPVGGSAECGSTFNFAVTASGTEPLAYQWKHAGTNIPGANTATLSVTASMESAGAYVVEVSNAYGSTTSAPANLVLEDTAAPSIACASQMSVCTESNSAVVTFTVTGSDSCDANVGVVCTPASGSDFPLGMNTVECVATDAAGNTNACSFAVVVLQSTTASGPADSGVCEGGTVTLSTTASGTGPFTYVWRKGGTVMVNETNGSITITGATVADAATYCVEVTGACNSVTNCAAVTFDGALTSTGPADVTACTGSTVTLTTVTSGSGTPKYRWTKNGLELPNETNSTLTLVGVASGDGGSYCVEVTGACASVTNCATLMVNPLPNVSVNSGVLCVNQSMVMTATTDAANPTYLWSPGGETTASIEVAPTTTTTYTVTVTDGLTTCSASASGTATVNPLPNVTVNSETVCAGGSAVLTATTDVPNPSYLWSPGGETTASITVSPTSTTTYTCMVIETTTGCSRSGSGMVTVRGFDDFANTGAIAINDAAAASPYPSTITVSGLTATVCRVTVSLNGINHPFPDDIDVALVGPNGEAVLLMSDVGGADAISGLSLTFDDQAGATLPDASQLVSGTFKPSNIGAKSDGRPDNFPAPAPTTRYSTNLSVFSGIDPNGAWSLYVLDDELVDAGQITGGWGLSISTLNPIADVSVSQLDIPDPVAVGSNLTYTVIVTNNGPAAANNVLASDTPPAGATLVSFEASQGTCALLSGTIWCELGSLGAGESATITVVVSPAGTGTLANVASVEADEVDFNSANNSSSASTTVLNPPVITTGPQSQIVCADSSVTFTVVATGEPPLSYQWYFGIDPVPGATSDTLVIPNAQPGASGGYAVVVNNAVGADSESATLTVNPLPVVSVTSTTICLGASATLTAEHNAANATYLWSPGGETTQSITVTPSSTTTYTVLVTDGTTTCTNSASGTVNVDQPTTATSLTSVADACPGTSASFSTTAGGTGPHTYVWRKDGTVLAETGPTLTIASVASGDAGTYCVEVTGVCNSVTNCATLTLAAPPTIASQPQSISRPMGNSATFSVTAGGAGPFTYQWQLNGTDISGETAATLTVPNLTLAQNGNQYSVIVSNCAGTTASAAATLTVTPIAGISFDFDTPGQFTNTPYNVRLNDWLHTALPAAILEMPSGGVNNSGALDLFGATDSTIHFHPLSYDFSQDGKTLVASVMVRIVAPTQNNRNTHIGFITETNGYAGTAPGRTGAGINDNNPIGFMTVILQSTAQPALTYQLRLQHRRTDGGITEVTPTPTPQGTLTAGNWYKLVATFQNISATTPNGIAISASLQDMGANGLAPGAVAISYPPTNIVNTSMVTQRNVHLAIRSARSDTGADLWDNVYAYATPGPVFFVAQPQNQTVAQGSQATFTALVDGEGPYTYQWNKNGSPIPGARNWRHITAPVTSSENGDQYTVTVTGPDSTVITSDLATLTVQGLALAVTSVGSVDGTTVGVQFNQPVDETTAETAANYLINGTAPLNAVVYTSTVDPRPTRVLLTPASLLTAPYTVTVENVRDLSGNTIGANSTLGRIEGLQGVDVNPAVAGPVGQNYSFGPAQLEITGGGTDIFSSPDAFRYLYTEKTGDFDMVVRVPYQDVVRGSTKAGFEARLSLDPTTPHVLAAVNPRWPGRSLYEGTFRQAYGVGGSSWGAAGTPVLYPDGWLRFRRVGNTFLRYSSQNGATWQLDGQVSPSPAFPETVLLGLAVCPAANGNPQTASFDNLDQFVGYPGATIEITSQPVGSATVNGGGSTNLTVTATVTGAPANELAYVWQRHAGGGVWTNVTAAGQTNPTFNAGPFWASDNGAEYRVVLRLPGVADVISTTTTVTVNDATAPTVTAAVIPPGSTYQVVVTFSEPVATISALNVINYGVTNDTGSDMEVVSAAFLGADPRVVVLTTANQLVAGAYTLRVSGVEDLGGTSIVTVTLSLIQHGNPPQIGPVVVEFFGGLTNGGGIGALINNVSSGAPGVKFANDTPDFVVYSNVFGINPIAGNFPDTLNHYGIQMYTYFVPPTTGTYRFYVRGDDFVQFLMNTNAAGSTSPAGATLQRELTANAQAYTAANSVTLNLTGGQRYYMELRFKETTGGDGATVAVRTDTTVPGQGEVIPGTMCAFPDAVAKPTPVAVELYTGQVTLNSILPNDLGAAFGNGGYPDLLAAVNSPAFVAGTPNIIGNARYFGFNTNMAQINATFDNYLGRLYANFIPPSNGLYKFYVRADDSCELWMNTNAANSTDPAGKTLLGIVNDFYDANQRLVAQNVYLNGDQSYYMEGRWREGGGGDGMTVTFRAQSDLSIPPTTEVMPGTRLEFPTDYDRVGPVDATLTPTAPVVSVGETVTFQVSNVRGAAGYGVFWLKNGELVAANSFSYVTQPLSGSDNGAVFTVVVTNAFSRVERSATVTVTPDNAGPTILSAVGSQYQDLVVLTLSEPVTVASGSAALNYAGDNGLQIFSASVDQSTRRRVTLRTSPQTPGTAYTITVNNVQDAAGNSVAANTAVAFTAWIAAGKGFYVEVWTNIAGTAVANLTGDARYINNLPDITYYTNRLGAGWFGNDTGLNNFGVRLTGLFSPPTNGLYRFYVRGDDGTMILMNTNGPDASGRVLIARNDGANSGTWENGVGGSASPILTLDAGTLYFMEVFMKEGGGGDHLEVMLRQIDPGSLTAIGGVPGPSVNDIVPGDFFVGVGNPDRAQLTVTQTPDAELTVAENDTVTLAARGHAPDFELSQATGYRWQVSDGIGGFNSIPGAVGPTFTFIAPATDTEYRVIIGGPGTNAVYTTVVHSSPDAKAPFMISASSLNGTNIDILWNEPLEPTTSVDPFNYSIMDGSGFAGMIAGFQHEDRRKITITLERPVTGTFTIEASGISDVVGNSDFSTVNGRVGGAFVALDVGAPVAAGSTFNVADGEFDVVAGGNDIWGTSDVGHLTLTPVTGDFDVHLRLAGLTRPDAIAKAGLMVRETLDANSRVLHTMGNPSQYQPPHPLNPGLLTGRDLGEAAVRFATGQGTAGWQARPESSFNPSQLGNSGFAPVGVPNTWLRIKREGNVFTAFHGYDGVNWRMYARATFSYPRTVYLGMGTTAHTAAQAVGLVTVANYRDVYIPPPPVILVQPAPSSQTVALHASVSYSVVASNPPPNRAALKYQWFRNGIAIANATSDSLSIPDAQPGDAGVYTVEVSNDGGTATSDPVTLNVDSGLIAAADAINTTQNVAVNIDASTLLGNDSAAAGDAAGIVAVSGIFPVTYASDFNAGLPAGGTVFGASTVEPAGGVNNSGMIRITTGAGNLGGSFILNDLSPNRRVTAFTASFRLRIGDGSAEPADGFSFNFARDLPIAATTPAAAENGGGSGFSFCVDNYRFNPYPQGGNANTSGLKIRYGNLDVAGVRTATWNTPRWVDVSITITPQGQLTVLLDGTNVFGNITLPNYQPSTGRFGFYARTGGQFQSHAIDDLSITALLTRETTREPAVNTDSERVLGNASVSGGILHLTDNLNSQQGTYQTLILNTQAMTSLTANFNVRIGGGTARAADGISMAIAPDLPNASFGEEGAGTYLIVSLDTWDNGTTDTAPSFDIKWGGTADTNIIATKSFQPSARYQREAGRAPATEVLVDGSSQPVLLDTDVGSTPTFVPVSLTVESDGTLDLSYKGVPVFQNLAIPGFYGATNLRVGFGGRTGGANDNHWIDDLSVTIGTTAGPVVYNNDFSTAPPSPYGTVLLSGSQVVYTPPANVCGTDTFYYLISGQFGGTAVGRVDVNIAEATPTPPVITGCPTNRTIAAGLNCLAALPDLTTELGIVDNCCCPTISQDPPPGTLLPRGTHTVTFTATDTAGLTAQCQATITVADLNGPVIALIGSGPLTVECHSNSQLPGATATDDCDGDLTSAIIVGGFVDRNVPGAYTLTYDVSDSSGNPAQQVQRIVNVVDTSAPTITCPSNIVTSCTDNGGATVTWTVTASDICDSNVTGAVCTPASGSLFAAGVTTVTCVATDASGNTNACSFTVTVNDNPAQLTIERQGTNTVVISWPQTCGQFILEQTDNLGAPVWGAAPDQGALVGGRWTVTIIADATTRFYRLRSSNP